MAESVGSMIPALVWNFAVACDTPPFLGREHFDGADDPVLTLWHLWDAAYADFHRYHAAWCALEAELMSTVGRPRIEVPLPDGSKVMATSVEEVAQLLGTGAQHRDLRRQLQANLTAQQRRWDEAAEASGLNALEAQDEAAYERAVSLAAEMAVTDATTMRGAVAKLAMVVVHSETDPSEHEFPWPHLRSTLADFRRLIGIPRTEFGSGRRAG